MQFLILGPLEVSDDGRKLALGGPKQRAVLAHLILRANHVVPADLLIDGLWGEEPPESARNTLQTYVYRLRKMLGEDRIEGRDGGYVLAAADGEIDAVRFEALVKQGKAQVPSDPAAAAATLSDALSLWRADALADVTEEPSLRGEAARLEELRLSATEHRVSAEIAMGGHSTVVPELESLTARYPLRERMWANLMLALYRSGRQAEALSTFERARQVLADELGADPSPELQRLHEQLPEFDSHRPAVYHLAGSEPQPEVQGNAGGPCAGPQKLAAPSVPWTRAPAGTIAFEQQGEMTLMDPGGFAAEQLAPDTETRRQGPDWSPNGSQIVFAEVTAQGDDDLYLMNADGSGRTQLTDEVGDEYDPAWSPDGSLIACGFDDLGLQEFSTSILTVDPRSGDVTSLVTRQNERLGWPAWSPDGTRIAFSAYSQTGWDLYVMDADGGNLTKVHDEPRDLLGMPIAWTPDGRQDRVRLRGSRLHRPVLDAARRERCRRSCSRTFRSEMPSRSIGRRTVVGSWTPPSTHQRPPGRHAPGSC